MYKEETFGRDGKPPPLGQSPFMKMIEREYDCLIRGFFNTAANRNLSFEENEDIFHDTILKCNEHITDKGIEDEDEMKSYLFRSLKTNGYREKEYHRNKNRVFVENIEKEQPSNLEYNCDLNTIRTFIKDKYGEEILDMVMKHLEGYSIREIEESTNKKGLNYVINKVLKHIRRKFK